MTISTSFEQSNTMQNNQQYTETQPSQKTIGHQMNQTISKMQSTITTILSIIFPFRELNDRPSVFIQSTWIEKVMTSPQLKDYLWQSK
jgi:hypothetical protein